MSDTPSLVDLAAENADLRQRKAELERENAALREALQPFMEHPANDGLGDDRALIEACRAARAVLLNKESVKNSEPRATIRCLCTVHGEYFTAPDADWKCPKCEPHAADTSEK